MNSRTEAAIREAADSSNEGLLHFGQVVGMLRAAGVESYAADYRTGKTTYYLENDETLVLDLGMPAQAIARDFDVQAVQAAIRGAQQDTVRYPEFKRLSCLAGCVGYTVWIAGRHVSYVGRKGETHVEHFPS